MNNILLLYTETKDIMGTNNFQWLTTTERYIVFLDIMGFKEMVMRNIHEDIYAKFRCLSDMSSFIEEVVEEVSVTIFSDSVIIFSKDSSEKSLKEMSKVALVLFAKSIKSGMGIKGGLAKGLITVDKKNQIFFGRPIIDTYLLMEELNYYGVIVHHSAENAIKEYEKNDLNASYSKCKTYFKSGQIAHYNLNWFYAYENDREASIYLAKTYLDNIAESVSGKPRKYIDNTFDMIDRINRGEFTELI